MEFNNLTIQNKLIRKSVLKKINKIFNHGQYILGPEVKKLENELKNFSGAKYCITCSNGTDAILMALMAINIKRGDEVITSPFSFIAATEMILLLGAKPIFIDICDKTFNLDVDDLEKKISKKTKAIIPISLFGQCAELNKINKLAKKNKITVIEDAAQSFGAMHFNKFSCNICDISTTSFFPSKPLGGYGDGGAIFTNNKKIYKKIISLRVHGQIKKYDHKYIGINGRMDTIQATIISEKLKKFRREIILRNKKAKIYNNYLKKVKNIEIPHIEKYNKSVYAQYCIKAKSRNKLKKFLFKNNIPTAIYYPKLINKQSILYSKFNFTKASKVTKNILALPFSPYILEKDIKKVSDKIRKFYEKKY